MASSLTPGQMLTFALNPSSQTSLSPALQQRACDRCRHRKTRCDGLNPCKTCSRAGAECLYILPQKPKGRRPRSSKASKASEDVRVIPASLDSSNPDPDGQLPDWTPAPEPQSEPSSFRDTLLPDFGPSCLAGSVGWSPPVRTSTGSYGVRPLPLKHFPSFTFMPYLELFFDRLYPIFPVLEHHRLRDIVSGAHTRAADWEISSESYALLTSLSAAVILQLNLHDQTCLEDAFHILSHQPGHLSRSDRTNLTFISAENFIFHCLQARGEWDYMATPSEAGIMTSFFLFGYYGNQTQSAKAWYYLREAIGFALAMRMDEPEMYASLPAVDAQRQCRLFWLLFISERAYALQHRSTVILRPSIPLPHAPSSQHPGLIYGFVNLVSVFRQVDKDFVTAWKAKPGSQLAMGGPQDDSSNPVPLDNRSCTGDLSVMMANKEIVEIQYLDISVTQKWLPLIEWQLKNGRRLISTIATHPISTSTQPPSFYPKFPFKISQELLTIISRANRRALESHGIGMVSHRSTFALGIGIFFEQDWKLTCHPLCRNKRFSM